MLNRLTNQAFNIAFSQSEQLRNTCLSVLTQVYVHQFRKMEGQGSLTMVPQGPKKAHQLLKPTESV